MTGRRVAGVILLALGVVIAFCSAGFVVAYYQSIGFYDGPQWLAELGRGSLVAGGGGVLLGVAVAGVGVVLVAKRRTPAA